MALERVAVNAGNCNKKSMSLQISIILPESYAVTIERERKKEIP